MISKKELIVSMKHEVNVIKHLAGKLRSEDLEYRPSEHQRSMLELLQYLTNCASGTVKNVVTGNWDHIKEMAEEEVKVDLSNFNEAMDRQVEMIEEWLSEYSDEELAQKDAAMPWGTPAKGGVALMDMGLKCLVAYRMQLFLYAKATGHTKIGPANCWAGVDWEPPESGE